MEQTSFFFSNQHFVSVEEQHHWKEWMSVDAECYNAHLELEEKGSSFVEEKEEKAETKKKTKEKKCWPQQPSLQHFRGCSRHALRFS
jgi:hypothetical protein